VDIQGERLAPFIYPKAPSTEVHSRYYARVMQVFPPRSSLPNDDSPSSSRLPEEEPIHKVASDLKLPTKDAIARDDPQKYLYKIQIHEENQEKDKVGGAPAKSKWSGSLMEVQCGQMR
jgi:bromodomain adjacent to zinc finger domain protein 1A